MHMQSSCFNSFISSMFYSGFQHKTSINKKYIKDLLEIVQMLISTSNLHYFGYKKIQLSSRGKI